VRQEIKETHLKVAKQPKKAAPKKVAKKKNKARTRAPQDPQPNGVSKAMHLMLDGMRQLMVTEGIESLEISKNGDVSLDIRKVEVAHVSLRV
jgi:hypothetical protein